MLNNKNKQTLILLSLTRIPLKIARIKHVKNDYRPNQRKVVIINTGLSLQFSSLRQGNVCNKIFKSKWIDTALNWGLACKTDPINLKIII